MSSNQQKIPKHILKLSTEEKRKFLDSFDNVFSDIDGVAWKLFSPIKNAEEGYKLLEKNGKNITYTTNNSVRSMEEAIKKFEKLKMNVGEQNIYHPATNIVKYLKNINFKGPIYVIGSEFFTETLRAAGFELIDSPHQYFDGFLSFGRELFKNVPARAVVVDTDLNLSSLKLIRAQLFLNDTDCLFIGGATDMLLQVREGTKILGPGQILKLLADITKRKPTILGKPGLEFAELLKKDFKITDTKRALMIGDSLEQDIGFGKVCGFQTLAVLSGVAKLENLVETNPDNIPDYFADSMSDFIEFFNDINKSHV